MPEAKHDDISLISETHMVEGKNQLLQNCPLTFTCALWQYAPITNKGSNFIKTKLQMGKSKGSVWVTLSLRCMLCPQMKMSSEYLDVCVWAPRKN